MARPSNTRRGRMPLRQFHVLIGILTLAGVVIAIAPGGRYGGADKASASDERGMLALVETVTGKQPPIDPASTGQAADRIGCRPIGPRAVTEGPQDKPVVALTFDDGPSEFTAGFLKVLKEEKVPATFFVVGQRIAGKENLLRQMLADGHVIGNHSYNHANLTLDRQDTAFQIPYTDSLIEQSTGYQPCIFRAPFGAANDSVLHLAEKAGDVTIGWDVDPNEAQRPDAATITERVLGPVKNGSIILMHDGQQQSATTLQALPGIIDNLKSRGFQFKTVPDLLGFKPIERGEARQAPGLPDAERARKQQDTLPTQSESGYGAG